MATTKKLPVSISFGSFNTSADEFLGPSLNLEHEGFEGLKTGAVFPYGALSYLGKEITTNDVFARIVDAGVASGRKMESVAGTLATLEAYFEMLREFKIGNILTIEQCSDSPHGFRLRKVAERPVGKRLPLP